MATVNLSGIITPSNVLTASSTATLTNKTINGSNNTLTNVSLASGVTGTLPIANGGTNSTATPTAGTIPYGTGTALAYSAAGTSGQLLQSNGAAAPSWVAPSSGALVLISTTTASGSANTLDITTGFSSTYDDYLVIGENIKLGVNSSESIDFRIYTGSSLRTSSYQYHAFGALGAASVSRATTSSVVSTSIQVYTATTISLNLFLRNANSASSRIQGQMHIMCSDDTNTDGNNQFSVSFGNTATSSALTGIRFLWTTGSSTFASGTFRLYGITKS